MDKFHYLEQHIARILILRAFVVLSLFDFSLISQRIIEQLKLVFRSGHSP